MELAAVAAASAYVRLSVSIFALPLCSSSMKLCAAVGGWLPTYPRETAAPTKSTERYLAACR